MTKPFNMAEMEQYEDENVESSGRGGYVCQIEFERGWIPNPYPRRDAGGALHERFFSVETEGDDAKEMASAVGKEGAKYHYQLTLYGDTVLNRDIPQWNTPGNRRLFQIEPWVLAYTDYLLPSLAEAFKKGFLGGRREWAHVQIVLNEKLKERYPDKNEEWVPVIVEYFPSEQAAREYVESEGLGEGLFDIPAEPEEWASVAQDTVGDWKVFARNMGKEFQDNPNLKAKDQVWDEAGVTKSVVKEIKDSALADSEDDLPF